MCHFYIYSQFDNDIYNVQSHNYIFLSKLTYFILFIFNLYFALTYQGSINNNDNIF